jgi:protein-S-isoprenylcysteine O-methyltransferase Ste14
MKGDVSDVVVERARRVERHRVRALRVRLLDRRRPRIGDRGGAGAAERRSLISDGLVVLGFFIVFLVFRENSYASAIIEVSNEQKVITTGPHRVVRHPMYAGAILLLVLSPLALGSWVGLPFSLPLILVVAARLLEEEKFLRANLGGYEEYRQKVRYRLIPLIW